MFRLIAADLVRHRWGALAIALLIALATALGVVVTLEERALRLGSARAAAAFDLVIGAPGSETQLVLSAVFLQPAPLTLLPGSVLAALATDPRVAYAAPVGFGDFSDDRPVIGTTQPLVDGLGGVTEGHSFRRLGDAIMGAAVPRALGDSFHPMHGLAEARGGVHSAITYRIVGRLAPTGTAWDRAILVPIEAVWRTHAPGTHGAEDHGSEGHGSEDHEDANHAAEGHAQAEAEPHDAPDPSEPGPAAGTPARTIAEAHRQREQSDAAGFDAPINPEALTAPDAPGVPAIVVKPRTIADAYRLRQAYRTDHTLAVFPGEVLTRLYGTLGDARQILAFVTLNAQLLVAAAVLLVVLIHVMGRRRQIGALRAFGAPRAVVCAVVWLEAVLVIGAGLAGGFALGFGVARLLARQISMQTGVVLPVGFAAEDGGAFLLLFAIGGLAALLPAVLAYRQSPAAALRA
ncbi:FtsX-like permease family protein [Ancylobacter polymorphus]|uniref:ABC transport system permease protein n=1 Tax=Ancylobacter polymorphus TaxID=223390 RepID=A0ABU0B8K0_9HYPH|nr:ABC transporter permease [Ancylobacter polymorphus]MDQ0301924.1 putative ABC transport system permease protein [Ancylobacter polymorphus]